jgi:hypothetical protein
LVGDCPSRVYLWFRLSLLRLRWRRVNGLTILIKILGEILPKRLFRSALKV